MRMVKRRLDNSVVILDITGKVVLGESADQVSKELTALLAEEEVQCVLLNMEHINYMDSTGLGELVGHLNRYRDNGKRLRLVKPSETIEKLMKLTRLGDILQSYPSEEAALEDLFE